MFVFVISNFMKSSTVYAASLCTFVRFESMIWPRIRFDISLENVKRPSDIFSHRKLKETVRKINLAAERKPWMIFLLRGVHLWKKQTREGRLKDRLWLFRGWFHCSLLAEVSHDEAKMRERRETSAGFRRVSYHACAGVSLTTSDVFLTAS